MSATARSRDVEVDRWTVAAAHALAAEEVARRLESDPAAGLSESEAAARLEQDGANALAAEGRIPFALIAVRQFADPLVALLVGAVAVSLAVGERVDAIAIAVIVLLNAALGFSQEAAAERAIVALRDTVQRRATVIRGGSEREIASADVVAGDLIVLGEGDRVPADGRIVACEGLAVEESLLTGESVPADKSSRAVPIDTVLAERLCMVFSGTAVTRGRALALVTATGARAEVGRVAALAASATPPPTPLQRRLGRLTRLMVLAGALITAGLGAARLAQGASVQDAFLLGVSVAVAAVPEGLAATVTIALALGARRMAARGAIVRRLTAVETLGSATVIASDKTGTLTENRMRLAALAAAPGRRENDVLTSAVLASTARLIDGDGGQRRIAGDPVEGALLLAAHGRDPGAIAQLETRRRVRELPFDPERRRMTIVYRDEHGLRAYMKGAPEVVIDRTTATAAEREALRDRALRWAAEGLRVLAVAERRLVSIDGPDEDLERDHTLVGVVALEDPLRPAAADAVQEALGAGLSVRILTGDHPATAHAIAAQLGLPQEAVFARITPQQKLALVESLQRDGEVVAVTGDGINDAPALRRGDVGVAMGRSGTEAAREAADLVLTDDDFSTIVAAISEGRAIADNIRKFVAFLLSANLGEVLLFAIAVLAGLGVPMTVVQVLLINVITDGLPAIALARDPPAGDVLRREPERTEVLFAPAGWLALLVVGILVGVAAVGAFLAGRAIDRDAAQTIAFATIACSELLVVFAVRSPLQAAWREPRNGLLLSGVAVSACLVAIAIYLPSLHAALGTVALDPGEIALVLGLSLAPALAAESGKALLRRLAAGRAEGALRAAR